MPDEMWERLVLAAKVDGVSANEFVRLAITDKGEPSS
jgi:hypothetical protein